MRRLRRLTTVVRCAKTKLLVMKICLLMMTSASLSTTNKTSKQPITIGAIARVSLWSTGVRKTRMPCAFAWTAFSTAFRRGVLTLAIMSLMKFQPIVALSCKELVWSRMVATRESLATRWAFSAREPSRTLNLEFLKALKSLQFLRTKS